MRSAPVLLAALALLTLGARPAAAQLPAPSASNLAPVSDLLGTWVVIAAADVPVNDELGFTRMAFTDSEITTTAVFVDPDDGELSARITTDRYRRATNGQLLVRAAGTTTVFDVARVGELLTVNDLRTGTRLALRPANPADAYDPAFVGAWAGQGGGHEWRFRFDSDGRAFVGRDDDEEDSEEPYTVAGPFLLLDEDAYRFTFASDRLTLDREDETIELFRSDAPGGARPGSASPLND